MESLLQSQIQNSCRLALPEGLKDLMFDISREVLRAQPPDIFMFIADHLSALLRARDTLSVACQVCCETCECPSPPELKEELENIGLQEEDLETALKLVMEYFNSSEAIKEGFLLMKLFKNTNVDEKMLPSIQEAIRKAFLKHQLRHSNWDKASTDSVPDRGQDAACHTLTIYDDSKSDVKNKAATLLQTFFRGYLVKRWFKTVLSKKQSKERKTVHVVETEEQKKKEPVKSIMSKTLSKDDTRLSATSLAGSFVSLPNYIPYSIQDLSHVEFVEREVKHGKSYDYTLKTDSHKTSASEEDVNAEYEIEEEIVDSSDISSVDENIIDNDPLVNTKVPDLILTSNEEDQYQIEMNAEEVTEEILPQKKAMSDEKTVKEECDHKNNDFKLTPDLKDSTSKMPLIKVSQEFTNLNFISIDIGNEGTIVEVNSSEEFKEQEVLHEDLIKHSLDNTIEMENINDIMLSLSKLDILEQDVNEDDAYIEETLLDEAENDSKDNDNIDY